MTKIFHHAPYPAIAADNPSNSQLGRTVLITGSSSGVGFATAQAFKRANASCVILSGRNTDTLARAAEYLKKEANSTQVLTRVFDINDEGSIDTLWKHLADDGIVVDVLILNAADTSSSAINPLLPAWSHFKSMFNTNVFGTVRMAAGFLDGPNATGANKSLINMTSCLAHSNPARLQASYAASKLASSAFFQHLAQEVPVEQCRIINLHPGLIPNTSSTGKAPQKLIEMIRWDQGREYAILPDA